jgi:tetratricopeptide (TPR) repeat protein
MADRPIECRALAVMREARGKKKNWLAIRLGMTPGTYYEYENGKQVPSRELLERAAAALNLSPHHVDRTLAFLRRNDAEAAGAEAGGEVERLAAALGTEWEELYRSVFLRSQRLARAVAEREMARIHFPRLRAHPAAERPAIVRENVTFQSWAISELACHESIAAAAGDPDEALAWAELAVLIADLAPGEDAFRARSRGYAAFHLGNAFRVKGRLRPEAEVEIRQAKALWATGEAGDPERLLDEARVLGMEASLKREQRQLPESLDLLDRALAVDRGGLRSRLLINRAKTLEELGDFEQALATLRRLLPLVDTEREPDLHLVASCNVLVTLCHLGHHAAAAEEFEEVRNLAKRLGGGLRLARLGWLYGWIQAGLGQPAEAEAAFERVRREFLRWDIPFDAALASLELAALYKEQGRTAEVKTLTRELAPVFESQRVSREALATLALFREAVEQDTLTLELARQLLEDFRRNRCLDEWS